VGQNPYDQALEDILGEQARDPYADALEQQDEEQARKIREHVAARSSSPDEAAEALKLSQATGLPVDVVSRNLPEIRKRATVANTPYRSIVQDTPALGQWLAQPQHAAIAHDDMEQLGFLSWLLEAPSKAYTQTANQQRYGELRYAGMFRPLTQQEHDELETAKYHSTLGGGLGAGHSWFRKAITGTGSFIAQQVPVLEYGAAGAVSAGAIGAAGGAVMGGVGAIPGALTAGAYGARAGLLYGVLKNTYIQEAANAYDEFSGFRDEVGRPLDPTVLRAAAIGVGMINAPIEAGAQEFLLKSIPGFRKLTTVAVKQTVKQALMKPTVRAALLNAVKSYGKTLTAETAQEVGQRAVAILLGEVAKSTAGAAPVEGQLEAGNIPVREQPRVENPDGSVSTVDSVGVNLDGREYLLPTVTPDGRHLVNEVRAAGVPEDQVDAEVTKRAVDEYRQTGRHLGVFATPEASSKFAEQLHTDYAEGRLDGAGVHRTGGEVLTDLRDEAVGALQAFALGVAAGPVLDAVHDTQRVKRAERAAAWFQALGDGAKNSKAVLRSPEAVQALFQEATKHGPVTHVYAPRATWAEYWTKQGVDPGEVAAKLTGDPKAWEKGETTGEDLAIPTANYAVFLAGTDHNAFLSQELRLLGPDSQNAREAKEAAEQRAKERQAAEAVLRDLQGAPAVEGQASPIREAMRAQFEAAGFDADVADTYAGAIFDTPFGQLGARAGINPFDLFAKYGIEFNREDLQAAAAAAMGESTPASGIPASTGSANETGPQRTARRLAHTAALISAVTRDAQQQDPDVDVEQVRRELGWRLAAYDEGQQAAAESDRDPGYLLRAVAKAGGLKYDEQNIDERGELRDILESRDTRGVKAGSGRVVHNRGAATWKGVAGVVNRQGGGLALDDMLKSLQQDGAFQHLETVNDLLNAISHAVHPNTELVDTTRLPGTDDLAELGVRLGSRWWERRARSKVDRSAEADVTADDVSDSVVTGDEGDDSFEFSQGGRELSQQEESEQEARANYDRATQAPETMSTRDLVRAVAWAHKVISVSRARARKGEATLNEATLEALRREADILDGMIDARGDRFTSRGTELFQDGQPILNSLGRPVASSPDATAAFARWFAGSKVVDAEGRPLVVYHGTGRLDRMGPRIQKRRATSGPMPFFTAVREIASRYAEQKQDTSLALEDQRYETWFRLKVGRQQVNLDRAWWFLTPAERQRVAELAPRVYQNDDGTLVLGDDSHVDGSGGYDQHILEARGNHFAALVEEWLNSANLFDDERRFLEVLKLAGAPVDRIEMHDPSARFEGVLPVYLAIRNPLETRNIPDSVVDALERRAKKSRGRVRSFLGGADAWDKTTKDIREWVKQLKIDRANGINSFVWSSIPDAVTRELQALGYDGIHDTGGKTGGEEHDVWVPFTPQQVKSAIGNRGTFDPRSPNILYQPAYHGSPHLFDRFSVTKIGTGEGAQVYGWGLYFASLKEIAAFYRRNLAGTPKGKRLAFKGIDVWEAGGLASHLSLQRLDLPNELPDVAALANKGLDPKRLYRGFVELHPRIYYTPATPEALQKLRADLEMSVFNLSRALERGDLSYARHREDSDEQKRGDIEGRLEAAADALYTLTMLVDGLEILPEEKPGRLYTVDIPEDGSYLLWDKSLQEQPEAVRRALEQAGINLQGHGPHFAAARALFLQDARTALEQLDAANGRTLSAEEREQRDADVDALITRMMDSRDERGGTDQSEANWERLFDLFHDPQGEEKGWGKLGNLRLDLNRIHDIANSGLDQAYLNSLVEQRHNALAADKYDELVERDAFLPMAGAVVKEGEDADYPFDVVEADGFVVDSYDNEEEAQAAADELNEKAQQALDAERFVDVKNTIDHDDVVDQVREELGLQPGTGGLTSSEFSPANSGEDLYARLSSTRGGAQEASKYLASLGINGIQYLDGSSRAAGEGSYNYVVFDDRLVQIVEYEHRTEDEKRGVIRFGADRQMKVTLFKKADLSTVLHESGHIYLEVLGDLAEQLGAGDPTTLTSEQRGLLADYGAILKFLEVENRRDIGVEQHEKFARAFEAYLFEGKAPSVELRNAFARFASWLKALYKSLTALNVELTPEVRDVFDRMFAADEAIAAAKAEADVKPLFETFADAQRAGMTELEFASYLALMRDASQREQEELQARLLRDLKRAEYGWWKDEVAATTAAVELELGEQPVYRALAVMRTGKLPNGETLEALGGEASPVKLSKAALVAQFGKDILNRLPRPYVYSRDSGISPDAAAELFGFSSGDDLVKSILTAKPFREAVEAEVDRRMLAKHGDVMRDGRLEELAKAAVAGEHRERVIRAELKALTRGLEESTIPSAAAINAAAKRRVDGSRIRDIRPGVYLMAAQRASRQAFKLMASGEDRAGAVRLKLQELVNLALYRQARDAHERVESMRATMQALTGKTARQKIGKAGADYLEQIDALLERYELSRQTLKTLDRRESLRVWMEARQAEGLPVQIPDAVLDAAVRVNYQDVTLDEFTGVYDAVEQIAHVARLKYELLKAAKQRTFEEARDALVASIHLHNATQRRPLEFPQAEERKRSIGDWFASHAKIAQLARALDGHQDGGEVWEAIIRPLNAAAADEQARNEQAGKQFLKLLEQAYPKGELRSLGDRLFIAAIGDSLSKEARLAVALNWGNETSRDRLLNDPVRRWNHAQVLAILDTLDRRDWEFVQGVWDFIDQFWPESKAKQERVTGIAPDKVEASPVDTKYGVFRGGYYPLVYDGRLQKRAGILQNTGEAMLATHAAYVNATTRRGHLQTRKENVQSPIRLELSVVDRHVQQVIHDLTHHEVLLDVNKLLSDGQVQQAILETKGDVVYDQFTAALEDIASGGTAKGKPTILDKAAAWARGRTQIATMAFNVWMALQQPAGVFNGASRVGGRWVLRGMARWLRDAVTMENTVAWIYSVSPMMRSRGDTATQDLHDVRQTLEQAGSWFDSLARRATNDAVTKADMLEFFLWHIGKAQQLADVPVWLGAYEKAAADRRNYLADGTLDQARVVALADQAVLDSQGGGQVKDLAKVQRGTPIAKLLMTFYSYGNTVLNSTADAYGKTIGTRGLAATPHFLGHLGLLYALPAVWTIAISRAMGRTGGDGDDTPWYVEWAKEMLSGVFNTMVLIRELAGAGETALGLENGSRGYEGPAGLRPIQLAYQAATQVRQGKVDRAAVKAGAAVAGILFGAPATQIQKTVDGFVALKDGKTRNPFALLVGAGRQARH
jgi:hypothetical protein